MQIHLLDISDSPFSPIFRIHYIKYLFSDFAMDQPNHSHRSIGQLRINLLDDYEHSDDNIEYIIENVLQTTSTDSASYRVLREQFNSFIATNCQCNVPNLCWRSDCKHGGNYVIYDKAMTNEPELILNNNRPSRDVIYECSEFCGCPQSCCNRLVQFGPRNHLRIEDYSHLGKQLGLTTKVAIPKGAFICEYAGEILCKEEAIRRHYENDASHRMNYIICLNERPIANEAGTHIQTFIDPSKIGNIGRYLNHSCEPNCEIISVRVDSPIPKLCKYSCRRYKSIILIDIRFFDTGIFANRDIQPNEELCFDYGEDEALQLPLPQATHRKKCNCGAEKCRKYLPNL